MEIPLFKTDVPTDALALPPRVAARALGVSPRTLWAYTKSARIPHLRIGRRVVYPVEGLREWLKQSMIGGSAAVSG